MQALLLALSQAATLATVVVMAWQRNWPLDLPGFDPNGVPFAHNLPTLRLDELFAAGAIAAYALAGWPGRDRLARGARRWFALALATLWLLAALSSLWAAHRGLAEVQAGHMLVWALFALMLACADWPDARLAAFFLAGLLIHSAVGLLQVALQHFVGLGPRFGEVPVRPEDTWASVVFAGQVRLLRAYGLSGHPNVLGGHAAVGLIAAYGLTRVWPRVWRALIFLAWAAVWALLLLTFSRSAWLSILAGGLAAALLLRRGRHLDRRAAVAALPLVVLGTLLAIGFVSVFGPFLVGRVQTATQPLETFSIEQREEMIRVALQLISAHPLTGVGAANFGVASQSVTWTHYALDWIHNVPLLVAAELGLPGLAAYGVMIGSMLIVGWRRWRVSSITLWQALVGGGVTSLMVITLFDHYLWTAPQGTMLWALLTGWWMGEDKGR
ncbi:MAG TPA: O-antigen ligase family protein [Anaerolineae bacterium]|nr:O-antigen ligase family protein [Anaerolineae bacterium]